MVQVRSTIRIRRRSGWELGSRKLQCRVFVFLLCSYNVIEYCSALVPYVPQNPHDSIHNPDFHRYTNSRYSAWNSKMVRWDRHSKTMLRLSGRCSTDSENTVAVTPSKIEPCTLVPSPSSVLRNIHQSRVPPELWQSYFCPSLSLVQTIGSIIPRTRLSHGIDAKIQWDISHLESLDLLSECFMDMCDDQLHGKQQSASTPRRVQEQRDEMCCDIAEGMRTFTRFCMLHRPIRDDASFSLRLVSSYGTAATKCPQWHIDHVPCRYIQALHGPGCMFIENGANAVVWDRMNALYDDNDCMDLSIEERNSLLIDPARALVGQAQEGEAIILLGNEWWKKDAEFHPAVHKSPQGQLAPWQSRILLTMDVVEEHL